MVLGSSLFCHPTWITFQLQAHDLTCPCFWCVSCELVVLSSFAFPANVSNPYTLPLNTMFRHNSWFIYVSRGGNTFCCVTCNSFQRRGFELKVILVVGFTGEEVEGAEIAIFHHRQIKHCQVGEPFQTFCLMEGASFKSNWCVFCHLILAA